MLKDSQTAKIRHKLRFDDKFEFVGTQAFKVTRAGYTFKLFHEPFENGSSEVLEAVIAKGVPMPILRKVEKDCQGIYKYYDYWAGQTFRELITAREIKPEHYEKLGEFVAKVNSVYNSDTKTYASFINYLPKNIVLGKDGEVFVCDHNKLVWSDFPENSIVRYVLTEDLVDSKALTFELRTAFLKGYRRIRSLSLMDVLAKQSKKIYGDTDVYTRDDFSEDPTYIPVKAGLNVLSLSYGKGETAFSEMYHGAQYSYACDIRHVKTDKELFKSSDYGKLIAYAHGFDGRDLHYKWIELNSNHFIEHLKGSCRQWDTIYLNDIFDVIAPEHAENLTAYLKTQTQAEII